MIITVNKRFIAHSWRFSFTLAHDFIVRIRLQGWRGLQAFASLVRVPGDHLPERLQGSMPSRWLTCKQKNRAAMRTGDKVVLYWCSQQRNSLPVPRASKAFGHDCLRKHQLHLKPLGPSKNFFKRQRRTTSWSDSQKILWSERGQLDVKTSFHKWFFPAF